MMRRQLSFAFALSMFGLFAGGCGQSMPTEGGQSIGHASQALSTGIVISQVYGGSGSSTEAGTSPFNADYVELFNRGTTAVDLTGWALQYSRADHGPWNVLAFPSGATIAPGHYYLIQVYTVPGALGSPLPTPDFIDTVDDAGVLDGGAAKTGVNYGTFSGLVAITNNTTALTCGNDAGACSSSSIVDFLGYGTSGAAPAAAPVYEGSGAAPTGTILTAITRKNGGCTETDDNAADFELVTVTSSSAATTGPRNSSSAAHACSVDAGGGDATADTAVADTATPDTAVADSTPADTATADTGTADTGTADTGSSSDTGSASDTGSSSDTGSTDDTGSTAQDSGSTDDTGVADTGTNPDDFSDNGSGCGCRVAGEERSASGAAAGVASLLFAFAVARRRRR